MIKLETAHIEELRGIRKLDIDFAKGPSRFQAPTDRARAASSMLLNSGSPDKSVDSLGVEPKASLFRNMVLMLTKPNFRTPRSSSCGSFFR